MSVLYVAVLISLALLHLLVRFRAARLEKRYARTAAAADALVKESGTRGGTNRADPYRSARQQYELALLALKRDRLEGRYNRWQAVSERFGRLRGRLGGYRGRVLPYLAGLVDVAGLVVVLERFEVGLTEVRALLGM
jgi:hypothetical protein